MNLCDEISVDEWRDIVRHAVETELARTTEIRDNDSADAGNDEGKQSKAL